MSAFNHTVLSRKKEDFINKFFLSLSMRTRARGSFGSIRHSTNQFSFKPVEWLIGDHVYAPLHHTSIRVRVCYMLCFVFFFRSCYCWCCCCCCIWISCGDRSVWFNEQYKWWSGAHTGGFANIVRFKSIQLTADHRRVNCLILVRCFGPVSPCFVRNLHLELIDWM